MLLPPKCWDSRQTHSHKTSDLGFNCHLVTSIDESRLPRSLVFNSGAFLSFCFPASSVKLEVCLSPDMGSLSDAALLHWKLTLVKSCELKLYSRSALLGTCLLEHVLTRVTLLKKFSVLMSLFRF